MKPPFRLLLVVSAILSLANCDKPLPPAAVAPVAAETDNQLAEARDALQRQALEIETKTALMDKQLAEMAQSLKDRDNAELRSSLEALKRQNDELRGQAEAARQQSDAIAERIPTSPPLNVASQPMALPDYSLFYDELSPYGRWFEVNGYGYCWRPTITVAGWRPYVDGCWVWSSLGWAWQSNEPFGWATYHYGRWVNLARYGWIWVPGSDWAPAWVAWRQSRDCVGWAPLPPEQGVCSGVYRDCDSRYGLGPSSYTFINTTQFVSPTYIHIYAPVTRQTTIFQHSVNVTQIGPSHSRGHAFVHQGGPPRSQVEQACGQPVPQRQVQTMHADQMPTRHQPHGRRDATAPVAMVELPVVSPGARLRRPEIKEHVQKPVLVGGFEGVPQQAAREIRENIAKEKETAVVQQQPAHGRIPHQPGRHPAAAPVVVKPAPMVPGTPPQENASSAIAAEKPVPAPSTAPVEQPGRGGMPHPFPRRSEEAPVSASMPAVPNAPTQESVRPAVTSESGSDRESKRHGHSGMDPQAPNVSPESKAVENSVPVATPSVPSVMPAVVENKAPEPAATPGVPASAPESTPPAVVSAPPAAMPQPSEPLVSPPPGAAEKMAAEAEKARVHPDRERGHAAATEQRHQREMQERGLAEKKAAEQAAMNADAEKSRMQAAAAQQEAVAAQQQRMAADQAAAVTEKARQQAAATAAQQQQEMAAQQQRAAAERMASEQAAAEAERVRQQTEAVAMQQRQQEEATRRAAEEQQMKAQQETQRRTEQMAQRQAEEQARRAAEEQQMRAQQETERRAQEMAQRQAEEQARRQQEAEMQRAQEHARRAAEEQQMRAQQEAERRAQEMAQRQAEEQARRQQEAEMQRAQEQARRVAQEQQMRAQQEAAQRAQEMTQRQAEEQARRAQEMAQRQAEEQARRAQEEAQRAAAEAARNQPQPAPGS